MIKIFNCRHCGEIIAKKDGNLLFFKNCLMTLLDVDLRIDCECGEIFTFKHRKPRNKVLPNTISYATMNSRSA